MKTKKKEKMVFPEVHILGDLQDVKRLIKGLNRKKTIVIFQDGEQGSIFLEIEGKFQSIHVKDIKYLEKEYKLIYFSFFPGRKQVESSMDEKPEVTESEAAVIPAPEKKVKKEKAVTASKTNDEGKQEKIEKKGKKEKKKK